MADTDDFCKNVADHFGIMESHDEWCQGSELCRECFIATLREAKKTADRSGRDLCVIRCAVGCEEYVDVYMSADELNPEATVLHRERQGSAKLHKALTLLPSDPLALTKVEEEIRARARVYPCRVN